MVELSVKQEWRTNGTFLPLVLLLQALCGYGKNANFSRYASMLMFTIPRDQELASCGSSSARSESMSSQTESDWGGLAGILNNS